MSTFDDASLVFIPSGYKTSKAYSVKPTDGTGDLTFSRSNDTATRVGPDGLIEKVRTNLAAYSNAFDNAYWTKPQASVVGGQSDPNGGTTAFKLVEDTSTNLHWLLKSGLITGAGEFGLSIFAKPAGRNYIAIGNASLAQFAYFNLSNGTIVSSHPNAVGKIEAAGNGYYRCSVTLLTSTSTAIGFFISTDGSTTNYTGDGTSGLFLFGAQLETGVTTDYIATTSAAVSVGPVANVPRLDYLNSSCPRLLLEPQRQNLALFSESFNNAAWGSFQSAAVTANTTISPDGYQNADTITFGSDPSSLIFQNYTSTSSTFTISVYAKSSTGKKFCFRNFDGVGVVRSSDFTTTSSWQRFTFTFTSALSNVAICNEVGGTVGSIQVYGCQLEAGAYATSYIPTLGASVTRGADAASKTGISSLIGQTEGTLFVDGNYKQGNYSQLIFIHDASINQFIGISLGEGVIYGEVYNAGYVHLFSYSLSASETRFKLALAYKTNDFAFYVNGVQRGVATSGTTPTSFDDFYLGRAAGVAATAFTQNHNQALLFKTRLSNSSLAELTSL